MRFFFFRTRFSINYCFIFWTVNIFEDYFIYFSFLKEDFAFIFNYFGSDIFLLLDRTLALDILHGSGKFTIISDNFKDLCVKVCFIFCKYEKFLDDAIRYRDCYLYPVCYFEKLSLLIVMLSVFGLSYSFFLKKKMGIFLYFGAYPCCIITTSLTSSGLCS